MTGEIYIKKRTMPQWFAVFTVIVPFLFGFLFETLKVPQLLKFSIDVMWFVLFVLMVCKKNLEFKKSITPLLVLVVLFFVYTLILHLINIQSPFYFVWGVRNNFRFYVAFFAFIYFLREDDAESLLKLMDVLFWVNVVLSFIQFFALGYKQDYLGGIFGTSKGCNAYSIIFFSITLTRSLLLYMSGKEKTLSCFSKCGFALIISALAELKAFFLFFVLITVIATFITSFSKRKLLFIIIGVLFLGVSITLLETVFNIEGEFTLEKIFELITSENYSSQKDVGRLTAIPTISKKILNEPIEQLFGLGLGNCELSDISIFNTPFYNTYKDLHYYWFSSAFLFLETGIIGFAIYLLFFIFIFIYSLNHLKKGIGNKLYCQMAIILAVMCVILTFYNGSLRTEAAYMMFFALALPFIDKDEELQD